MRAREACAPRGEAGRARDAARALREGLRYAPRDAGLWLRLVDALAAARDRRALAALTPPDGLTATGDGAHVAIAERRDAALARIPEETGPLGWPIWGGTPARDAHAPHETPMPTRLRWTEPTDWMERRSDRERPFFSNQSAPNTHIFREMLTNLAPMHPVEDDRVIFVSDGRSVRAYDATSARSLWVFDARSAPDLSLVRPRSMLYGRTSLERPFSPVVAGDLVVATVEVVVPYEPDHLQGVEITTYMPRRILVGLDRATGKLRWGMGLSGVDLLSLEAVSIISPPVVAEGLVLAVGSVHDNNHNVSFLAFDLQTGALRWRRPLGFGQQELNLFGAPLKELAASPIAVADGIAYASTGLGFVAAIDIRSGTPRWLASYEISEVRKVELWYDTPVRTPKMAPSPPVVHGDVLVVAPTDGEHLHVFDRRTGRLLWRKPYVTDGMVYDVTGHFLGVANDGRRDVVLLTDKELRARDLATGETVWLGRFDPQNDRVLGRGAIAGDDILIPTLEGLQRFALRSEGAYRGTVPWPEGAGPGNLLPLGRVLVVARQDTLQWFYDWAAIERDVARRRTENPDDPMILIEAGDMYLRGGGEVERALKAFEEARTIAKRARPELEARALRGMYDAWLRAGDEHAAAFEGLALKDYEQALAYAQDPSARTDARIRIHRLLRSGDARQRVRNLEALVAEAERAVAVFDPQVGEVPARAVGLFLLSEEHLAREGPTEAVDALQRILLEERLTLLPDGPAGELARKAIATILQRAGTLPYRRHEQAAKALLAEATASGDTSLIDRILTEYPNAEVVTDALLTQARTLVEAGRAVEATTVLQRLLAGAPPDHPLVPTALAALAWTYRVAGARGAASATLARLEDRYPRERVRWDGRTQSGAEFAAQERQALAAPRPVPPPPVPLVAPLEEVHFEPVGDEEFARPIPISTESVDGGAPLESPLALMSRGTEIVAIDLEKGAVAWTAGTGSCQRAAWTDGVLVLALNRELRGLDAQTGAQLWSLETPSLTRDMQVSGGLVIAQLQDIRPETAGTQSLAAIDAYQGSLVWTQPLPRQDYRHLQATGGRILLHQVMYDGRGTTTELLVYDAFDGTRRHAIEIPFTVEGEPQLAGGLYVLAGMTERREIRVLAAYDIAKGQAAWIRTLRGKDAVCCLTPVGPDVIVLRGDGSVLTHAIATGSPTAETRLYVTDRGRSCPFPGTTLLADETHLTMIPWARRPAFGAVCYDRRTGKLAWESPYPEGVSPSKAALVRRGDVYLAMVSHPRDRVQHILVRLIDARTGKVLQEIEPEGLSRENWIPSLTEGRGTVVIFGKSGASIFRSKAPDTRGR